MSDDYANKCVLSLENYALKTKQVELVCQMIGFACKKIGFEDQNNLFCSSDVSDDTKKFITSTNQLVINELNPKVTFSCFFRFLVGR